jgi:hypothetical protein
MQERPYFIKTDTILFDFGKVSLKSKPVRHFALFSHALTIEVKHSTALSKTVLPVK